MSTKKVHLYLRKERFMRITLKFLMDPKGRMLNRLQVKKNLKKGNLVLKMQVISKEISRKRTIVYKTQTTETTGSFYGVADCSDMETEVSDELKTKKAKQVASKKNRKKGNLVLKMQVYQKR